MASSYEVTATRKRPQDFDRLVGQDFVVSTLENAIKENRIAKNGDNLLRIDASASTRWSIA